VEGKNGLTDVGKIDHFLAILTMFIETILSTAAVVAKLKTGQLCVLVARI